MVFALMALAITGIAVSSTIEQKRFEQKQAVGSGEATVLTNLSNATNKLIFENFNLLRNGLPVTKGGVTVNPVVVSGTPVWRPTIAELRTMGYLPAGWTTTTSMLNDAVYAIEFRRVCVSSTCDVDGQIVISGPVRQDNQVGTVDGPLIGPILEKLGADAGVSLIGTSNTITGFSNTWTVANPVSGTPPGVVAVRVGSIASAYADFLRVGDGRDPNFAGNLTVAGNTTLNGTLQVAGATTLSNSLSVTGPTTLTGLTTVNNNLVVSGNVDGRGQVGTRNPADGCLRAMLGTDGAFRSRDPSCVDRVVAGPNGQIRANDAAGTTRVLVDGTAGTVTADANITSSGGNVAGQMLAANRVVLEGAACTNGQMAQNATGGILMCFNGVFRAPGRWATIGTGCSNEGVTATDQATGTGVICRAGQWRQTSSYLSPFQMRSSALVSNGTWVQKPSCGNAGSTAGVPLLLLIPRNDTSADAAYNRYAVDTGTGWTVALRDGNDQAATGSRALALSYCFFPGS